MKRRAIIGMAAFALTTCVMLPVLFLLTRNAVTSSQFLLIVIAVLSLVLWTIPYITLIDPKLRQLSGAALGQTIEWRGTTNSLSWTPSNEAGCFTSLLIDLLGYFFIGVWFFPFAVILAVLFW